MLRPREPLNLRHLALQGVLCLILAGTLGLAALVRNHRLAPLRLQFERPEPAGPFKVRYPKGWELRPTQQGAVLLEPGDGSEGQRRAELLLVPSAGFVSPLELLVRMDWLDPRDAAVLPTIDTGGESGGLKPLAIAGWPGISVSLTRHYATGRDGRPQHRRQTLACTVLPSGDAIALRLDGRGFADASDEQLIQRLASSLTLAERPDVQRGGDLQLGDGVEVSLPAGLSTLPADAFRTGRVLLVENSPRWLAVELVPCLFPPEQPGAEAAFASLMALRDPYLRWKKPERLDGHTWVCEREPTTPAVNGKDPVSAFPARAYLRTTPGGHALLAEFRWVPTPNSTPGAPSVEQWRPETLWPALADALRFPGAADLERLLLAGHAAVRGLPPDAVEVLNTRPEERWQWYHGKSPKSSSALLRYDATETYISGEAEFDRSPPLAPSGWEVRRWRLWRDWSRYNLYITRTTVGGVFSYETRVEGKEIDFRVRSGPDDASVAKATRTPLFVPGAVLPLVLGRLAPGPMVLQTDAIPSPLTGTSVGLLTLRLEPATDVPKHLPDDEGPMLCWSVRVNGSGQSSRWYFDRDKRLQSISFAGDVHFQRVEEDTTAPASQPTTLPTTQPGDGAETDERPAESESPRPGS